MGSREHIVCEIDALQQYMHFKGDKVKGLGEYLHKLIDCYNDHGRYITGEYDYPPELPPRPKNWKKVVKEITPELPPRPKGWKKQG